MTSQKSNNLGAVALTKARELQALIDILNNTTVGSLNEDITANANAIISLNADVDTLDGKVTTNTNAIASLNAKMNALATLFTLVFNQDGSMASEAYTTHTHDYEDATIADTADGTGVESSTTKTTAGVN